jgi:hypothetical protein
MLFKVPLYALAGFDLATRKQTMPPENPIIVYLAQMNP